MTHCPQCGATVAPEDRACSACGLVVALVQGFDPTGRAAASRTIMGGVELGPLRQALPPAPTGQQGGAAPSGSPRLGLGGTQVMDDLGDTVVDPPRIQPGTMMSAQGPAGTTRIGVAEPPPTSESFAGPMAGATPSGRTLMGVATPGVAPLHPERVKIVDPRPERGVAPMAELGATAVPAVAKRDRDRADLGLARMQLPAQAAQLRRALRPRDKRAERLAPSKRRSRATWLLAAAAGIVLAGVLVAMLWPTAPPLSLRVTSRDGADVLAFECAACPDGTVLRAVGATATVQGGKAEAVSSTPLGVGETLVRVEVDRPGDGRDEVVSARARVSYRIKLDLATLAGRQPSISVVVEAVPGTRVTVDGAQVDVSSGVGTRAVDVSSELTGQSLEAAQLVRKIPYTIEPRDAPAESGVLTAKTPIVPLRIDAPGPTIVTDRTTFVLAGRTAPGAELTAAGHPIAVKADGTFAHVMSVSSTGSTQIEVRAVVPGKAPRIEKVAVERVATLEEASRRFRERSPLGHADVSADPAAVRGKPIIVSGEIMEVRRVPYQTIAVVNVDRGCTSSCLVRVVIGADAELKQGSRATFYGQVSGAFAAGAGPAIPEIDAAFFEVHGK